MSKKETTTASPKMPAWWGYSAKNLRILAASERDPVKLGHMLAFIRKRVEDHTKAGKALKASKWERLAQDVTNMLASPQPLAATFTASPAARAPKAKPSRAKPAARKSETDARLDAVENALAQILAKLNG